MQIDSQGMTDEMWINDSLQLSSLEIESKVPQFLSCQVYRDLVKLFQGEVGGFRGVKTEGEELSVDSKDGGIEG